MSTVGWPLVPNPVSAENPYLWIFLSGLCFGFIAGRLPLLFRRGSRGRSWSRWAGPGALFFSLALVFLGAALFFPRGGLFSGAPLDFTPFAAGRWLPPFGIAFILGALAGRFPRGAGIPLVLAAAALAVFLVLSLGSFQSLEEGVLMEYRILREDSKSSVVRMEFPGGREIVLTLEGRGIRPVVEQVSAPPALFFLAGGRLYRITRLERQSPSGSIPFRAPFDRRPFWGDILSRAADILPVLDYREDVAEAESLLEDVSYGLSLDPQGAPHLLPLGP